MSRCYGPSKMPMAAGYVMLKLNLLSKCDNEGHN